MISPRSITRKPLRQTLNDQVYQRLQWSLITGTLRPGETMTIRGLAEKLGVSTTPVRDGLRRLTAQRGLEILPNRRVRVPSVSSDRLSGLLEIRRALEGLATERATSLLTDNELEQLKSLCESMAEGIRANDVDEYLTGNYSFHFTIYAAQDNEDLVSMIEGLWLITGPSLREEAVGYGLEEDLNDFHKAVLTALRARNAKAARAAIEQDVDMATQFFMGRKAAN